MHGIYHTEQRSYSGVRQEIVRIGVIHVVPMVVPFAQAVVPIVVPNGCTLGCTDCLKGMPYLSKGRVI